MRYLFILSILAFMGMAFAYNEPGSIRARTPSRRPLSLSPRSKINSYHSSIYARAPYETNSLYKRANNGNPHHDVLGVVHKVAKEWTPDLQKAIDDAKQAKADFGTAQGALAAARVQAQAPGSLGAYSQAKKNLLFAEGRVQETQDKVKATAGGGGLFDDTVKALDRNSPHRVTTNGINPM